jgi:hypothetical protein
MEKFRVTSGNDAERRKVYAGRSRDMRYEMDNEKEGGGRAVRTSVQAHELHVPRTVVLAG